MIPVVALTYIATQRRAAYLSLIIALVLMAFLLYRENRRIFWMIVPGIIFFGLIYTLAFWNSSSKLALPVEEVKSVLSPGPASSRDQSSNVYRVLENYDILFTLRGAPIHRRWLWTTILHGSAFAGYQLLCLVAVHNPQFNSMDLVEDRPGWFPPLLFMVGFSLMTGIQSWPRIKDLTQKAAAFVAVFYIVTHFIYAYVDMSWDSRSMVYVGTMLGLINCIDLIAARTGLLEGKGRTRQSGPVAVTLPS